MKQFNVLESIERIKLVLENRGTLGVLDENDNIEMTKTILKKFNIKYSQSKLFTPADYCTRETPLYTFSDLEITSEDRIRLYNYKPKYYTQSESWDSDMSLKELIDYNIICKVDRKYNETYSRNDCDKYGIYMDHPNSNYSLIILRNSDGYYYHADSRPVGDKIDYMFIDDIMDEIETYYKYLDIRCENNNKYNLKNL